MRTAVLHLAVLLVIMCAVPTVAQDTPDACTPQGYANLLTNNAEALLKPGDDTEFRLIIFTAMFLTTRAYCADLAFVGVTNTVLGPIDLPAGDYVVNSTFDDNGRIQLQTITDECDWAFIGQRLASLGSQGGIDNLVLSTDTECRVLIEVNAEAPWTLTFTPVQ